MQQNGKNIPPSQELHTGSFQSYPNQLCPWAPFLHIARTPSSFGDLVTLFSQWK